MRSRKHHRGSGLVWLLAVSGLLVASQLDPLAAPARPAPAATPAPGPSPKAAVAVAYALAQVGKPYRWGAEGPGSFDCSGLTWAAWRAAGLGWGRMTAKDQWHALRRHEITRANLRPGDLVFYAWRLGDWRSIHHVGLYAGAGRMVEAPHPGAAIRLASINRGGWFGAARPGR